MNIADYRNAIRQDLLDVIPTDRTFNDAAVDRAILSAIEDLSRFVPREGYLELISDSSEKTETFSSTGITENSEVTLTHTPVRNGSESIVNGATTYIRDTDYSINYITGTISFPTGSAIIALSDGVTLTVTYQKSRRLFDLSTIEHLRSVNLVEVYNASSKVSDSENFSLLNNYIDYGPVGDITPGYRLVIQYSARHTMPDDDDDGSLSDNLAEIVIKGAEAALLFAKAISLELSQTDEVTIEDIPAIEPLDDVDAFLSASILADLASVRTALETALSRADAGNTAIGSNATAIAADLTSQDTIIAAITSMLANPASLLTTGAAFVDTEVATDLTSAVAAFKTAADIPLGIASTGIASGVGFIDTEVGTDLTDAKTALTTLLQGYLDSGDDFIETVNSGKDPAEYYRNYAETAVKKGDGIVGIASGRLALAKEYFESVDRYISVAAANISQGKEYVDHAKVRLSLAGLYDEQAKIWNDSVAAKINQAELYNNRIQARLSIVRNYVEQVGAYVNMAQGYQENAKVLLQAVSAETDAKVAVATARISIAATTSQSRVAIAGERRQSKSLLMEIAERLRNEAIRRYRDFQEQIQDKSQTRRIGASISARQPR